MSLKNVRTIISLIIAFAVIMTTGWSAFAADGIDISNKTAVLSQEDFVYTGKEIRPQALISEVDWNGYYVNYGDNVKAGPASVEMVGIGEYKGSITKNFNIYPKKPQIVGLEKKSQTSLLVNCDAMPSKTGGGGTYYQIRYRDNSASADSTQRYSFVVADSSQKEIFFKTSVTSAEVWVRAFRVVDGKAYYGEWSEKYIYKTDSELNKVKSLKSPEIVSAECVSVCKAELKWNAVQYATKYMVYKYDGSDYVKVLSTTKLEALIQGENGVRSKYKVKAYMRKPDGSTMYSKYSEAAALTTYAWMGQACTGENNVSCGGEAGDQTGREVRINRYYYATKASYNWDTVIRIKDDKKRNKAADVVEAICKNDCVGYDMNAGDRTSLYEEAKAVNWDIDKLRTPCETSCTRLICVAINAAGIDFPYDIDSFQLKAAILNTTVTHNAIDEFNKYTGPETTYDYTDLNNKDEFEVFTTKEYFSTYKKLKRGDILCCGERHSAMIL